MGDFTFNGATWVEINTLDDHDGWVLVRLTWRLLANAQLLSRTKHGKHRVWGTDHVIHLQAKFAYE